MVLCQLFFLLFCQQDKLLVSRTLDIRRYAFLGKSLPDLHGIAVRLLCDRKICAVFEQSVELKSQHPAFCQQSPILLHIIAEMILQLLIYDHHSLSHHGTAFCAADVENVRCRRNIRQSHVISLRAQAVTHPGAVHHQIKSVLPADPADPGELFLCVDGAVLRRKGQEYHLRLRHVFRDIACPVALRLLLHSCRRDLSVHSRNHVDLVSCVLHCTGLVNLDMS